MLGITYSGGCTCFETESAQDLMPICVDVYESNPKCVMRLLQAQHWLEVQHTEFFEVSCFQQAQ